VTSEEGPSALRQATPFLNQLQIKSPKMRRDRFALNDSWAILVGIERATFS
jgi:hypothetical protein